jgi:hypothetical protein
MWKKVAASALILSSCVSSNVIPEAGGGAVKETFAYGDYILNLQRRSERYLPQQENKIIDCSGEEFLCLKAGSGPMAVANLVLPKRCVEPKVGDTWSHAGLSTRVLGRRPGPDKFEGHHGARQERFLLGSLEHPGVVFEYARDSGVDRIYKGAGGENIVERAARNPIGFPEEFGGLVFSRTGYGSLGTCEPKR